MVINERVNMSKLLDALRQVEQAKQSLHAQQSAACTDMQKMQCLSVELKQLAQQVCHTAQALLDDFPELSIVAQQSIDKTCKQIRENNIPVLTPLHPHLG